MNAIDSIELNKKLERISFQNNTEVKYGYHLSVVVEDTNKVCGLCKTLKFKDELPGICCSNFKVKLPIFNV